MDSQHSPPLKLNEGKIRVALGDPDTPALVLMTIVLWTFGPAVFGDAELGVEAMDPSEMWAELNERYGVWVPEEGENKLNAMITGLTNGMFWRDEEVFLSVATALYDGDLGDLVTNGFEDVGATEIMWAMLEMELAWDAPETPEFSRNVRNYIEKTLRREQEDQSENTREIDHAYIAMLRQLRNIGVPTAAIRLWDEEYADVMEQIEAVDVS